MFWKPVLNFLASCICLLFLEQRPFFGMGWSLAILSKTSTSGWKRSRCFRMRLVAACFISEGAGRRDRRFSDVVCCGDRIAFRCLNCFTRTIMLNCCGALKSGPTRKALDRHDSKLVCLFTFVEHTVACDFTSGSLSSEVRSGSSLDFMGNEARCKNAGLLDVSTYLHWCGSEVSRMDWTRLAT